MDASFATQEDSQVDGNSNAPLDENVFLYPGGLDVRAGAWSEGMES